MWIKVETRYTFLLKIFSYESWFGCILLYFVFKDLFYYYFYD